MKQTQNRSEAAKLAWKFRRQRYGDNGIGKHKDTEILQRIGRLQDQDANENVVHIKLNMKQISNLSVSAVCTILGITIDDFIKILKLKKLEEEKNHESR